MTADYNTEDTALGVCRTCGMPVRIQFNDAGEDAVVVVADCSHIEVGTIIAAPGDQAA